MLDQHRRPLRGSRGGPPLPSSRWRAVAELVRAPAALTVPGDSLAGAVAAGRPFGARTPLLGAASVCLYWAGMALNDFADRDADARERPERPIPSGRVRPGFALGLAAGLTGAGLALAAAAGGGRALRVAVPLAATVWAYDLRVKRHPVAGPVTMAAARGLDVLLGAGPGRLRAAAPAAGIVAGHTLVVSALGRHETTGAGPRLLGPTLCATAVTAGLAARAAWRRDAVPRAGELRRRAVVLTALGSYAVPFAGRQLAAFSGRPQCLRRAVSAGVAGMLPLQAACLARSGAPAAGAALLLGHGTARHLFRKVTPA
ncbi:SCO3242 family prenyltransferase [Streptomyces sp. NPDC046727]|uniref:SCO3242 family prenyltransferase n=1 Tax=Streptomyces sp. NPDC046727 TaxID=3155373 RepID=UPI0033DCD9A2